MIQSKIILAETDAQRRQYITRELSSASINSADIVYLERIDDKEHIGISQVRDFARQMILSPMVSSSRVGVISNAQLLTIEAQNALLKIIEEPPKHALFILGSHSSDALLPTVVSRCQVIQAPEQAKASMSVSEPIAPTDQLELLIQSRPSVIISTIQPIATDRLVARQWAIAAIQTTRGLLLSEVSAGKNPRRLKRLHRIIRALEQARKELDVNVTHRFALEHVFLSVVD